MNILLSVGWVDCVVLLCELAAVELLFVGLAAHSIELLAEEKSQLKV